MNIQNIFHPEAQAIPLVKLLLFLLVGLASAQSENHNFYWFEFGLGTSHTKENVSCINLNAAFQFNQNLLTARMTHSGELFGTVLNDYSMLYNRAFTSSVSVFHVSIGCGLGFVNGKISHGFFSDKKPDKIETVLGLPFEARLFWRPLKYLGIGLYGFVNLNSEVSVYGLTLSFQEGKLR